MNARRAEGAVPPNRARLARVIRRGPKGPDYAGARVLPSIMRARAPDHVQAHYIVVKYYQLVKYY